MKVAALTGFSGSGKTTLIAGLIERYVRDGLRVGAIKHTHHPLNEIRKGDTARFQAAGSDPVILAGRGEAVIFHPEGTERIRFERPHDLLVHFTRHDIVLVEGFRELGEWPQVEITPESRPAPDELAEILATIWRSQ